MTQIETIIRAMIIEWDLKEWWTAKDFQHGKYFIGYEASARMSEIKKMYPQYIRTCKIGKYRAIGLRFDKDLSDLIARYYNGSNNRNK